MWLAGLNYLGPKGKWFLLLIVFIIFNDFLPFVGFCYMCDSTFDMLVDILILYVSIYSGI